MKVLKLPGELKNPPHYHQILELEGVSVTETCSHTHKEPYRKVLLLKDHLLLFVLEGSQEMKVGQEVHCVNKGEMLLLKKATFVESRKIGNPDRGFTYEGVMFFLQESILLDFMKMTNIRMTGKEATGTSTGPRPYGERLHAFLKSLKPYFNDQDEVDTGLYRLKILELLYDLAAADKTLLLQLMQLNQTSRFDIPKVVEENYLNPFSMNELAYLSGRSLSTFRREFESIYHVSPAKWIQEKRLQKAKEMLAASNLSVADVCYQTGYENVSYFSRLYKEHFGRNPSEERAKA